MRIVAFRSGMIDHTLLTMLAKKNGKLAEEIVREVVPSVAEYQTEPAVYHRARRRILAALDGDSNAATSEERPAFGVGPKLPN